jgi:hypothetical protein
MSLSDKLKEQERTGLKYTELILAVEKLEELATPLSVAEREELSQLRYLFRRILAYWDFDNIQGEKYIVGGDGFQAIKQTKDFYDNKEDI